MELGPQLHRMNDDRLFIRVVVQNHHLERPTRAIRADDEIPTLASDHPKRIADRMLDVLITDPVLARAIRDLYRDKVALSQDGTSRRPCPLWTPAQVLAAIDCLDTSAGVAVNGDC